MNGTPPAATSSNAEINSSARHHATQGSAHVTKRGKAHHRWVGNCGCPHALYPECVFCIRYASLAMFLICGYLDFYWNIAYAIYLHISWDQRAQHLSFQEGVFHSWLRMAVCTRLLYFLDSSVLVFASLYNTAAHFCNVFSPSSVNARFERKKEALNNFLRKVQWWP